MNVTKIKIRKRPNEKKKKTAADFVEDFKNKTNNINLIIKIKTDINFRYLKKRIYFTLQLNIVAIIGQIYLQNISQIKTSFIF